MPRSLSRSKSPPYRRRYSPSPVGHRYSRRSRRDRSRSPYSNSYSRRKSPLSPRRGKSRSRTPRRRRSRSSTPRRYGRQRSQSSTKSPIHKSQSPSLSTDNKNAIERLRKEKKKKRIKLFTRAAFPKEILASKFQMSCTNGVQIGKSNMYVGSIENDILATYILYDKKRGRNNLTYWYNFGLRHNNPHILRVYGKTDYFLPGRKKMQLLLTEFIECTLEDWTKNNPLLHSSDSTRLSAPFICILLDILHALIYFRINLRSPFGEIVSHNIYIVGGRAKLGNVVDPKYNKKSFKCDIRSFCHMIKELFKTAKKEIPLELSQLFDSLLISVTTGIRNNENFLLNSVHHPVLRTPKQRGELRHLAFDSIYNGSFDYQLRINMYFEKEINYARRNFPSIQGTYWIDNVNEEEFLKVLYYQQPPPVQAVPKVAYIDTPLEFLRFSRNVGEHAQDNNKRRLCDDIKDRKLTLYLPGFLSVLHDILTHENMSFLCQLSIEEWFSKYTSQ